MTTATRPTTVFVLVNTLLLWTTLAIASLLVWPIYQSESLIVLLVASILAGSVIAIAGARFGWSSATVLLSSIAMFTVLGVPLAVPQEAAFGVLPSIEGLRQLFVGVALGWKQLLTITLPVGTYQALLVPVFTLVLFSTVLGLSLALRSRRGDLAVLAPLLVFVFGIAFGPDYTTRPLLITLTLVVVCLLWLMWRRWYRRRVAIDQLAGASSGGAGGTGQARAVASDHRIFGLRTVISAVLILAIAGGAAAAAAVLVPPEGRRTVLRTTIEQPFDPRDYPSPLSGFRRYLQQPTDNEVLFTVTGLPLDGRVRIATLDTYDGVVYSVGSEEVNSDSGSFTRVPQRFDQSAVAGDEVDLGVEIVGYGGVWMPTLGKLESVEFTGDETTRLRDSFYYNDNGGTGAIVGGLEPGDGYQLRAVVPDQPAESQLGDLTPGSTNLPSLGVLPAELELVLSEYTTGVEGAGRRLVAMLDGLRLNGYISHGINEEDPPSRSGHSADRVTQLLTDQRMIGDAEQYAVTAALMARQLGFPARVVFGFVPTGAAGDGPVAVRGEDVSAWIEVDTERYGWVTLDPTPPVREIPEELPEEPTVVSRPQQATPPQTPDDVAAPDETPLDSTQEEQEELEEWVVILLTVARILGWVLLAIAVLISPFLAILAAKSRRRRARRRAPTALARIRGGWDEYRDAVLDHGFEPAPTATRREVAAKVGGGKAAVLAAVTDRAVFAPADVAVEDADKVWRAVVELNASLDTGATRWQRLKAAISTRSLGGYSVSRLFKR
ncbi:transglutaminase domain-containing protein [Glaciihabitans arcticus]|uniref:Transglutaminase domain-containing protein n=1 Tax=Glaciihabitans arcticus TaxID=2668039 RepID=A0A4V2JEQ0_9MICO|nr:transglutaminase-like domain-containing protein [Glaciihabitans arcticus]TBN56339.1 transglutaminase domain-containing protein [Glaciihabitans arcticus]